MTEQFPGFSLSATHKQVMAAFQQIQCALTSVDKSATNAHLKNTYATLNDVQRQLLHEVARAGCALTQVLTEPGRVLTVLMHPESGEMMAWGPTTVTPDKAGGHGAGSANTYSCRYALVAAFRMRVGDAEDDDGNGASTPKFDRADYEAKLAQATTKAAAGQVYQAVKDSLTEEDLDWAAKRLSLRRETLNSK